jgi:hypothetical protein
VRRKTYPLRKSDPSCFGAFSPLLSSFGISPGLCFPDRRNDPTPAHHLEQHHHSPQHYSWPCDLMFRQSPGRGVRAQCQYSPRRKPRLLALLVVILSSIAAEFRYGIMYSPDFRSSQYTLSRCGGPQDCPLGRLDPLILHHYSNQQRNIKIFILPRLWITCILD